MRRRGFAAALGASTLLSPGVPRAQGGPPPVIGYLSGVSRSPTEGRLAAFRRGLAEAGYDEGRNAAIEYRFADGDYDRLAAMAAELARRPVNVIVAVGGPRAAQAARSATSALPIVFVVGGDPVRLGLVASMSRPAGNATGVAFQTVEVLAKRLEMLMQLLPKARDVALMVNPNTPSAADQVRDAEAAARAAGVRLQILRAGSDAEIEAGFATLARTKPDALLIGTDAFFNVRHKRFVALAAAQRLPAAYEQRNAVAEGGLMSYGPDIDDAYRQTGVYAGRVLAGARPADLPVLQPTKFELVLNLGTARALGLAVPQALRLRADEVVE
jgi:putative ABC transport system substrate-binding protein